jgi:hypothetical protein
MEAAIEIQEQAQPRPINRTCLHIRNGFRRLFLICTTVVNIAWMFVLFKLSNVKCSTSGIIYDIIVSFYAFFCISASLNILWYNIFTAMHIMWRLIFILPLLLSTIRYVEMINTINNSCSLLYTYIYWLQFINFYLIIGIAFISLVCRIAGCKIFDSIDEMVVENNQLPGTPLINTIYTFPFCSHNTSLEERKVINESHTTCGICLSDYINGDRVIEFECSHMYHAICGSEWIKTRQNCPSCRKVYRFV